MKIEFEQLNNELAVVTTYAMQLTRIQGYFNGNTANRWLQLHDTKTRPANAVAPLRSWPLYMTAPFDQNFQNDPVTLVNGCTLVVSTTQGTYTDGTDTMDIYVNGTSEFDVVGANTVGDYTTGIDVLSVVASGTAKKLIRVELTALSAYGGLLYLKLFATSGVPAGTQPIAEWVLQDNTSLDLWLNSNVTQRVSNVRYNGIYLAIDDSSGVYAGGYAGSVYAIKATYK